MALCVLGGYIPSSALTLYRITIIIVHAIRQCVVLFQKNTQELKVKNSPGKIDVLEHLDMFLAAVTVPFPTLLRTSRSLPILPLHILAFWYYRIHEEASLDSGVKVRVC